eukprot:2243446-Alexandrium_andersonii.AAC.1
MGGGSAGVSTPMERSSTSAWPETCSFLARRQSRGDPRPTRMLRGTCSLCPRASERSSSSPGLSR